MKKALSIILCVIMMLSAIPMGIMTANAAMADEAEELEFGVEYSGSLWGDRYFKFELNKRSHISINYSFSGSPYDSYARVFSASGKEVWISDDLMSTAKENVATGKWKGTKGKNLNAGTYYLDIYEYDGTYSFTLDAEKVIKLPKGKVTAKCTGAGRMLMKSAKAKDAIGYQFQISKNERFRGKVKTVKSAGVYKTVKGLSRHANYYVRVRPYTVYTDGSYVFGQFSLPKRVKIK